MKLLQLLKSRAGAISGVRAAVAGVMLTSAVLTVSSYLQRPTEPDRTEVRRVADLMAQNATLPPEYASIDRSFSLGKYSGTFATAEEKAKYNGQFDVGNDSADAIESGDMMGQVFSGHNGLGLGDKDVDVSASGTTGNVNDPAAHVRGAVNKANSNGQGAQDGAEAGKEGGDKTKVNKLTNATITHANGGGSQGSSSSSGTGSSTGGRVTEKPVGTSPVNVEQSTISGSMLPGSSGLVKANRNFRDPSYKPSRDDVKARKNQYVKVGKEADDLKYTSKVSAAMARKKFKSDNEGVTTAFMGAHGTTIVYGDMQGTSTNNDLTDVDDGGDIDKTVDDVENKLQEVDDYETKKNTAQNHLVAMILALVPMVIGAFFTIGQLVQASKGPQATWQMPMAIALGVFMGLMVGIMMIFAGAYLKAYEDTPAPGWIGLGVGTLMLGIIGLAFVAGNSSKEWVSKLLKGFLGKALGGGSLTGAVSYIPETIKAANDGSFKQQKPPTGKEDK